MITFFHDPSTIVNNTNGLYPQGLSDARESSGRLPSPASRRSTRGRTRRSISPASPRTTGRSRRRLTLNLGLRYDLEDLVNGCCWDSSRTYAILKDIGHPYGALPKRDTNNLAPRLGVAYDLHGDGTRCAARQLRRLLRHRDHHLCLLLEPRAAGDGVRAVDHSELGDRPGAARELCLRREPAAGGAGVRANRVPARRQRPGAVVHARFRRPALDEHVHWILASAQSDDGPVGRLPARADAERVALPADQSAARHRQQSRHAARAGAVGRPAARLRRPGAPRSDQHPVFVQSRVVRRN